MCPDLDELEQCLSPAEGSAPSVERHLRDCSACRDRLSEIAENLRVAMPIARALEQERRAPEPPLPRRIGPYHILRELGRGGMGRVYEAEQERPRRAVALKVIDPGFVSPSALRRFEYEAQVLGRLQHPGIAQVYEAGTAETEAGPRPYFAMEVVHGTNLRSFAERSNLSAHRRLALLAEVCDAVHHAHQKGVIHRDLKPGNVLIDEAGKPKVLDFGVARVVADDAAAAALTTAGTGAAPLVGTLPYMSPEQVSGDPHALDTRSDVYALGIMLYELLAGRLPYDLTRRALPEAVRIIRDVEPAPLSRVDRRLRGDVETIVLRALEKDRERRYASAAELAADIRRYLRDEPISARPASALYQLRKFARRNTALVVGGALTTAALVAGAGVSGWQAVRATRAEVDARQRLGEARAAQQRAEDKHQLAQRAAAKFQAVNEFMQDMLAAANPETIAGRPDASVRAVLDRAAAELDGGSLGAEPEIEVVARTTIGNAYRALAEYETAERHLRQAVGLGRTTWPAGSEDLAHGLNKLARLRQTRGAHDEAEALFREALDMRRELLGAEHPDVATIQNNLGLLLTERSRYAEAEALLRESLRVRRAASAADTDVATSLNNLGLLLHRTGQFDAAETALRESLALDRRARGEHVNVAATMDNLGSLLRESRRYDESEALTREALAMRRRLVGDEHPHVAVGLHNLALVLAADARYAEAEDCIRQALAINERLSGPAHLSVAGNMAELAGMLRRQGRLDEAEHYLRGALRIREPALGATHPDTLGALYSLAGVYGARGDHAAAEPILAEVVDCGRAALPAGHWMIGGYLLARGQCLTLLGRLAEAEAALLEAHQVLAAARGVDDPWTRNAILALVSVYESQGRTDSVAAWREELRAPEAPARSP